MKYHDYVKLITMTIYYNFSNVKADRILFGNWISFFEEFEILELIVMVLLALSLAFTIRWVFVIL